MAPGRLAGSAVRWGMMVVMMDTHWWVLGARLAKRAGGCESRRGEAGAENDSSAQRNTDDVDPDLDQASGMRCTRVGVMAQ